MPFDALARVHSQECAALQRNRSCSTGKRSVHPPGSPQSRRQASLSAAPAPVAESTSENPSPDRSSEDTLANINPANNKELLCVRNKDENPRQPSPEDADPYLVGLPGREHLHPHTWNPTYRWALTLFVGALVLNATFASSAPSNLIPEIDAYYGISSEVGTLMISLFVAGYCVGPLLWGPLSERYGRKKIFMAAFIPYTGFQVGSALAPNTGSALVFRFLGGCFAASPLTNSGGVIADLWDADRRGIALAVFSLTPFVGPALGPLVSGAIAVTGTSWRWIYWVSTIFAGILTILIFFFVPETYLPYILYTEAKRIRKETGEDRWHAAMESTSHNETIKEILQRTILKPFKMIIDEPMLLVITLYMSFIYGCVYLLFEALPIVYGRTHGLNALEVGITFLSLPVGGILATVIYIIFYNKKYVALHHRLAPKPVPPEERLTPLFIAAPGFALAFFWFGWTSYKSINIASPILAIVLLAYGILLIFLCCFNYLIDTYLMNAASALAINTVARSTFGAGFPLFASQMFDKLGTPGASSLLGGIAMIFIPVPFVLYKFGPKIRAMSKNAVVLDQPKSKPEVEAEEDRRERGEFASEAGNEHGEPKSVQPEKVTDQNGQVTSEKQDAVNKMV